MRDYKASSYEMLRWYELVFDDGHGNGCVFHCDEHGETSELNPDAAENLAYCRAHPEKFVRNGVVVRREQQVRNNPTGICECGETVELWPQYLGACECPKCGRWYNLFGQELNPPGTWASGEDW